jgi:co-chaperonin GroES (HSP10)
MATNKWGGIVPRNDWILVRVITPGTTPGGIIKPDNHYEDLPKVEILAVGPGRSCEATGMRVEMDAKPGDVGHIWGHILAVDAHDKIAFVQEKALVCILKDGGVN